MKAAIVGFMLILGFPGLAGALPKINTNPGTSPTIVLPPEPEPLVLLGVGLTWIEMAMNAPAQGASALYRQGPDGAWRFRQAVAAGTRTVIRDEPLPIGTNYCYRLDTTYNSQTSSRYRCAETDWRVGFGALQMDATQTARVLGLFDWRTTRPLPEGMPDAPALYYMNVLLEDRETTDGLWRLGVHVQSSPVFPAELNGWQASLALVNDGQSPLGRWHFAVVPGTIYNRLRLNMIEQITAGQAPGIYAMVFREIPIAAARSYSSDRHNLSYPYLGQQGFEYNAYVPCRVSLGLPEGESCIELELGGWILHKIASWVAEGIESVIEGVRGGIGRFSRIVNGEVTLTVQFELYNTDPAFAGMPMFSAWRGQPLYLEGLRVHVRQGLAAFYEKTDPFGRASLPVARNQDTKVCLEAENHAVMLTEFLTEELVCFPSIGTLAADHVATIRVEHPYFNVLAAMTDARQYVHTVVGHDMPKITVLVGGLADKVATEGRSFTPCMGSVPNLGLGGGADLLAALVAGPYGLAASTVAEFLYAVDIVLHTNDDDSRGTPVHEYGHAVMCEMLMDQGLATFQVAWTDVILNASDQTADNDATYLNEAFADFFESQVVGGTNYFRPKDRSTPSGKVDYCDAGSDCLEENYHELDHRGLSGDKVAFSAQVRRVASLLHDAFDGAVGVGNPNDASHWDINVSPFMPLVGNDSNWYDENVTLPGSALRDVFAYWRDRGAFLREDTFLGGLADIARAYGYAQAAICDLFVLHSSSYVCPTYAGGSGIPPLLGTVQPRIPTRGVLVK